jgi:hypothetical protein
MRSLRPLPITDQTSLEIEIVPIQAHKLANPDSGCIEQLEDRPIPQVQRGGAARHLEQLKHRPRSQVPGQEFFLLGRCNVFGGIGRYHSLAGQVFHKGAQHSQFPGN